MSIPNLIKKTLRGWKEGRMTTANLTEQTPDHVLVAKDVFFLGDGSIRPRKGYSFVKNVSDPVIRAFDFQRQSDQVQYLVAQYGSHLALLKPDGSGSPNVLSGSEDPTKPFAFVGGPFGLYAANTARAVAMYNNLGIEVLRKWGIAARPTAPGINVTAGTLKLTYGRQYVVCDVIKWTDSKGIQRYHIGPPSPISPHTGPLFGSVVTLSGMLPSSNPAVTHKWIFATADSPEDSDSSYLFAAEITNATTTWGDTLAPEQLDTTRVAPWDNQPAPNAAYLVEFNGRVAALGIPDDPDAIYVSAMEECDLGIPQESFPTALRFRIPGGIKKLTGGLVFQESLMSSTPEFWFQVRGTDATNFTKKDRLITPGAVGFLACTEFNNTLIWLAPDKKLYAWDGANSPVNLSQKLVQPLIGMKSMDDISDAQLANAVLRVFSFGRYKFLIVGVSTTGNQGFDWLQVWDATDGLAEADMFPAHHMVSMTNVMVGNTQYLFFGDDAGNLYRFPDGNTDAGQPFAPEAGTVWLDLDAPGMKKKFLWADITTDHPDALNNFTVKAVASDAPNMALVPVTLHKQEVPNEAGVDPTMLRAKLNDQKGVTVGRWLRLIFGFPVDGSQSRLMQVEINGVPLG